MKALVLVKNGRLELKDVPDPGVAEDECLLKVKAVGVCNSDLSRGFEGGAYSTPLIMGHEFSGEIVECGSGATSVKKGQYVTVFPLLPCFSCEECARENWIGCTSYDYYGSRRDGAMAEYISVKAWNLVPVPDECDKDLAALTEPVAVAIHALQKIQDQKKTGRVLVLGAGFIGMTLAKLLLESGQYPDVWIHDRNDFKLTLAGSLGLSTGIAGASGKPDRNFEKAFDIVIETCGAVETFRDTVIYVGNKGHVFWIGNIQGDLTFRKKEVSAILRKELGIYGIWNSQYYHNRESDWTRAVDVICTSPWLSKLVTHVVPVDQGVDLLNDMYQAKMKGRSHSYLKSLIRLC